MSKLSKEMQIQHMGIKLSELLPLYIQVDYNRPFPKVELELESVESSRYILKLYTNKISLSTHLIYNSCIFDQVRNFCKLWNSTYLAYLRRELFIWS